MQEVIFFMTIGLILLAITAIMIFFGFTERLFKSIKIVNWAGFLLLLALCIGAIVPNIRIGGNLIINISGFVLPIIFMVALSVVLYKNKEFFKAFTAQLVVIAITVLGLFFLPIGGTGLNILCSTVIGVLGGIAAYLIGRTRESVLYATFGGVALGELVMRIADFYFITGSKVVLGSGIVFDAIIIAAFSGIVISEIVARVRNRSINAFTAKNSLNFEVGKDETIKAEESVNEFKEYFDEDL